MSDGERVPLVYDRIVRETDAATLFDVGDGPNVWVPKSLIEDEAEGLTIPAWFAVKEGLE